MFSNAFLCKGVVMIYHQNGQPSLSFIRQALNTYYYSTGYPCTFIPFDKDHMYATQIGMPVPFQRSPGTTYALNHMHDAKSVCEIWHHGPHTYLTFPLIKKNTYYGLMMADISASKSMQHPSLQKMFTLCSQSNVIIEPTESPYSNDAIRNPFTSNNQIKHHPYHLERSHMQQMILKGQSSLNLFNDYVMPPLGFDELRSTKNRAIIGLSLLARTAISLGLDVHSAFSISDHYILAIESTSDPIEVVDLHNHALNDYHEHIRQRKDSRPPIIEAMVHYIEEHLTEKISLEAFASTTDYSYTYLSGLFKKNVGLTFIDYAHTQKIDHSCHLLKDTSYTLQMIADQYGYSYAYQYIKAFKKVMGVTPGTYRNILQAE